MTSNPLFLEAIEKVIADRQMLDHPFYQAWNAGTLSKEALQEYAKQYYHFVMAFPTWISSTHANTPVFSVRQELLDNLLEEEKGDENHPALWVRFANALEVNEEDARNTPLLPETEACIATMRRLSRDGHYLEGVTALYAYESQIPRVARVKIDGLAQFYHITEAHDISFFTVHEEADVYHSASERNIIEQYANTDALQQRCIAAAAEASEAMLTLLDGVYSRYVQPTAMVC